MKITKSSIISILLIIFIFSSTLKYMDIFWADKLATQAIERAKQEGKIVTCRSGASTSGAKHIGNFFDIAKSYIVHKAVLKKGFKSRFVVTHDDRDPLRKIPPRLPDLDGKWHEVDKKEEKRLSQFLGCPYTTIPDPFGCCRSWAEHFGNVWELGVRQVIKDVQFYWNNDLYNQGKFDPYIIKALKRIDISREVIMRFQETKTKDYIPFDAICENCGKITTIAVDFDLENKTITYECKGKELAGKYKIEGCGYRGTVSIREGKLPWSFEWPAQWAIFETTYEPFGKEHAEGSWPRCSAIMREVYGLKPPIPHVYEFLLVNGKKMSARMGNAYITQEMLRIMEPEVFMFFYCKRSKKQRNLDLIHIEHLVEDFEHAERVYFGVDEEKNEADKITLIRMYESAMEKIPEKLPIRIPYKFAAILAQLYNPEKDFERILEILKTTGHLKKEGDEKFIKRRLICAKNWVEKFAPEEMRINLRKDFSDLNLSDEEKEQIKKTIKAIESSKSSEDLQTKLYEIAKQGDTKKFFELMYRILISKSYGPRLAQLIYAIGREKVVNILKTIINK